MQRETGDQRAQDTPTKQRKMPAQVHFLHMGAPQRDRWQCIDMEY